MAQIGGRSVDEFEDTRGARVTHVVTGLTDDVLRAQRTLKYCCGVLCGAWVVSFEWVLASLAAHEWVEEADYELRGDTHGAGAPKKARLALRRGAPRLFEGLKFCFAGEFVQPTKKELAKVARVGGAELLSALPTPTTTMAEYLAEVKQTHVVIDPERTDVARAGEIHMVCGLVPVSYHWVLDSVSHYAVQPVDKYRIFVQEEGRGYETQQSLEF
jgi:BRCA1-associated RING domain protein 1